MFLINDIDVDTKVLALNKIIDRSPVTDSFLRERGVLSYPTKYQTEKLSITIGFDLSVIEHRDMFAELTMEVDEYPFVFIKSEKVKSMMFHFTEQDAENNLLSLQVFMVSRISASIDAESKDFVTLNLVLHPYNIYALVDSFSFLSYKKEEDGSFSISSGINDPRESLIYSDFFSSRKKNVKEKIKSFIENGGNKISDIRILSPYFTNTKPTSATYEIDYNEIIYTDPSGVNPVKEEGGGKYSSTGEQYSSFTSYISDGKQEDKYKRKIYVYWKGDIFTSDPLSDNAVTSIEIIRNNNIVQQPIAGHPYPVIQYMGKREGYFNISFISKSGENSPDGKISTPYTMFKALLEKYNYNILVESRFSAYNVFKIKSVLTSVFDLDGYVPAQVFLQNNSSNKTDDYTVAFIESSPFSLRNIGKGKIEKQKDNGISMEKLLEIVKVVNSNIVSSGKLDSKFLSIKYRNLKRTWISKTVLASIEEGISETVGDFIRVGDNESSEFVFIRDFYSIIGSMMKTYSDKHSSAGVFDETTSEFIESLPRKLSYTGNQNDEGVINNNDKVMVVEMRRMLVRLTDLVTRNNILHDYITKDIMSTTAEITNASSISEFKNFKFESVPDIKIGESLGIIDGGSYLGVDDPRGLTCAPFLTWAPLITDSEIKEEYLRSKDEIDKFYEEIYDKSKLKIEDAALLVAQGKLTVDRGSPKQPPSELEQRLDSIQGMIDGVKSYFSSDSAQQAEGQPSYVSSGSVNNLIEWIGSKDAGATGFEALNTVFCIKTSHGLDLTKMTVAQVMAKQPEWSDWTRRNKQKCNIVSHATGKYQAMHDSLQECINSGIINKSDLFDERTQDKFGFWAATIKSNRKGRATDYINKRNLWKAGKLNYYDYAKVRDIYMTSLASEWAALPVAGGGGAHAGQGGYVSYKEMAAAMDSLPLYNTKLAADAPGIASKLPKPFELGGQAESEANATETNQTGQAVPLNTAQLPTATPGTQEQVFMARYSGQIPTTSGSSPIGMEVNTNVPSIDQTVTTQNSKDDINTISSLMKQLGTVTDYTVFDHDINVQIQARDGTAMFRHGFNMAFPVVKAYIVFGGSGDSQNNYSAHKPNYIELSGLLGCNIVLNDLDNPVDVAYVQVANPGRVYTDQAMFWEAFKPKIDYDKIGTSEELRFLVDMMIINPGNRLHIKGGYGNDPNKLETIFNGEITSVDDGDTISLVAEGYGRELIMQKHGQENSIILSSNFNSGTRESIAQMLIEFDEIQNLGRRARSITDYFVAGFFGLATGSLFSDSGISVGRDDPESRKIAGAMGSDDSFSIFRFGSNFYELDTIRKQPMLRNIYAEEVTMVDEEFQYNFWNFLDPNRASRNFLIMFNHSTWEIMDSIMHRHPNTLAKPMFYENEMTLFYGIKDQCYLANGINERVQTEAAIGVDTQGYERLKFKRYKAVSQTHIVSSGVNLISNRMKVNSDFYTKVDVFISDMSIFGEVGRITEEEYWGDPELLQMQYDDNLRPNMIRPTEMKMNGCDSVLSAVRYGTRFLTDEVSKMYDGEIVIIGNENVKNGDVIFLNDMQRGLMGFVVVSECKHYYGASSGFTTAFRPLLFAEAKAPYFSNLGKKIRVAFVKAFIGIIDKISKNADKSEIFNFLNMTINQLGVTHSPSDYSWFPLQSIFKGIANSTSKEGIAVSSAVTVLQSAFTSTFIGLGISQAGKIASAQFLNLASGARGLLGNTIVDGAKWFVEGASLASKEAAASAIESLAARGVLGGIAAQLTKGIIRVFSTALENPVIALIVAATAIITITAFASLESFLLSRDPIEITPLIMFGRPYIAGITGARSEGLLLDTLNNFKQSLINAEKVWMSNYRQADILYSKDLVSPFDKDYLEY